jgi:hypothetical protein
MFLPASRFLLVLSSLGFAATQSVLLAQQTGTAPKLAPSPTVAVAGGPFGVRMGMSRAEALAGEEVRPFMFRIPNVPQPLSPFSWYVAKIAPKGGLCFVGGGTDVIQSDAMGTELRSIFQKIRAQFDAMYGASELVDGLRQPSLKREPSEWMKSLLKRERSLSARWSAETRATMKDGVRLIRVIVEPKSETSGFITAEYDFDNTVQCDVEIKLALARATKPPTPLWETTPLLLDGTRLDELPGAQLAAIRPAHVLDGDTFAFYADIHQQRERARYLFGWHRGQITVLASDARDKNAIAAAVRSPLQLKFSKEGTSLIEHRPRVESARGRLYIDEDARFSQGEKVYLWDGQGLRVALGPGDQVEFNDKKFVVSDAELVGTNAQVGALITFKTASPERVVGLGVHDGRAFSAVVVEDEPLPGSPNAVLSVSSFASAPEDPMNAILTDDGGIVWRALAKSGGKKTLGIFHFSRRETRKLIDENDPRPDKPKEKMQLSKVKVIAARDAENVMLSSFGDHYLLSKTGWRLLPLPRSGQTGVWITVKQAFLPTPDVPIAVFRLSMDIASNVAEAAAQGRFDVAVLDGPRCQVVYSPTDFADRLEPLPRLAPYRGWLAADWDASKGPPPSSVVTGWMSSKRLGPVWGYLGAEDWRRGFLPVPTLLTSTGSDVPLDDVGGWVSTDEAIARLSSDAAPRAGVYRMRRVPAPTNE